MPRPGAPGRGFSGSCGWHPVGQVTTRVTNRTALRADAYTPSCAFAARRRHACLSSVTLDRQGEGPAAAGPVP